jgi:hypothetical protein
MVKRTLRRNVGRSRRRKTHGIRRKTLTRRSQRGGVTKEQIFDMVIADSRKCGFGYNQSIFGSCERFNFVLSSRDLLTTPSLKENVCRAVDDKQFNMLEVQFALQFLERPMQQPWIDFAKKLKQYIDQHYAKKKEIEIDARLAALKED